MVAPTTDNVQVKQLIYENPLGAASDVANFVLEGEAHVIFAGGRMRLANARDAKEGDGANFVFWCPEEFPADVRIEWDFCPLRDPGLAMLFFSAAGHGGLDLFDKRLAPRNGAYPQYHSSDIDALHVSYFRRRHPDARMFQTCNLRKSAGFHLVAQGPDPLPSIEDARRMYRIQVTKCGPDVTFAMDDLPIFRFHDDGQTYGPRLGGGKIGFRQMAPLMAEYQNLSVYAVEPR